MVVRTRIKNEYYRHLLLWCLWVLSRFFLSKAITQTLHSNMGNTKAFAVIDQLAPPTHKLSP
jgi:hypothetical protein